MQALNCSQSFSVLLKSQLAKEPYFIVLNNKKHGSESRSGKALARIHCGDHLSFFLLWDFENGCPGSPTIRSNTQPRWLHKRHVLYFVMILNIPCASIFIVILVFVMHFNSISLCSLKALALKPHCLLDFILGWKYECLNSFFFKWITFL
jgi:hypothetical protein